MAGIYISPIEELLHRKRTISIHLQQTKYFYDKLNILTCKMSIRYFPWLDSSPLAGSSISFLALLLTDSAFLPCLNLQITSIDSPKTIGRTIESTKSVENPAYVQPGVIGNAVNHVDVASKLLIDTVEFLDNYIKIVFVA